LRGYDPRVLNSNSSFESFGERIGRGKTDVLEPPLTPDCPGNERTVREHRGKITRGGVIPPRLWLFPRLRRRKLDSGHNGALYSLSPRETYSRRGRADFSRSRAKNWRKMTDPSRVEAGSSRSSLRGINLRAFRVATFKVRSFARFSVGIQQD